MRTILSTFTAANQNGTPLTLLSGDTLAVAVSGAGNMTNLLQFQSELASGAPWVNVTLENAVTDVTYTTTQTGMRVIRGLPRGFYRVTSTTWVSGTKDAVLMAY